MNEKTSNLITELRQITDKSIRFYVEIPGFPNHLLSNTAEVIKKSTFRKLKVGKHGNKHRVLICVDSKTKSVCVEQLISTLFPQIAIDISTIFDTGQQITGVLTETDSPGLVEPVKKEVTILINPEGDSKIEEDAQLIDNAMRKLNAKLVDGITAIIENSKLPLRITDTVLEGYDYIMYIGKGEGVLVKYSDEVMVIRNKPLVTDKDGVPDHVDKDEVVVTNADNVVATPAVTNIVNEGAEIVIPADNKSDIKLGEPVKVVKLSHEIVDTYLMANSIDMSKKIYSYDDMREIMINLMDGVIGNKYNIKPIDKNVITKEDTNHGEKLSVCEIKAQEIINIYTDENPNAVINMHAMPRVRDGEYMNKGDVIILLGDILERYMITL